MEKDVGGCPPADEVLTNYHFDINNSERLI